MLNDLSEYSLSGSPFNHSGNWERMRNNYLVSSSSITHIVICNIWLSMG